MDAADMCQKLEYLMQNRDTLIQQIQMDSPPDDVALTADWLLGELQTGPNAGQVVAS